MRAEHIRAGYRDGVAIRDRHAGEPDSALSRATWFRWQAQLWRHGEVCEIQAMLECSRADLGSRLGAVNAAVASYDAKDDREALRLYAWALVGMAFDASARE